MMIAREIRQMAVTPNAIDDKAWKEIKTEIMIQKNKMILRLLRIGSKKNLNENDKCPTTVINNGLRN